MATQTMTTETIPPTMRWHPLPADLSTATHPSAPNKLWEVQPGETPPCRKCLQNGKPGEKLLLFSYDPWMGDSPYRQHGPIFVHAEPKCELAIVESGDEVPAQQYSKEALAVRAFGKDHMMVEHDVVAGKNLVGKAGELFGNDRVEYLHVHYAGPGCFAVRIDRV